MNSIELWKIVYQKLSQEPAEIPTVPRISRKPLWFYAYAESDCICVEKSKDQQPCCNISITRKITFHDFDLVYSYYDSWMSGVKGVRVAVRRQSRNTAYIFALIKCFAEHSTVN